MRTTNSMLSRQLMHNITHNYNKLMKHQNQVSTGKAFQRPSENPYNAVMLIDLRAKIQRLEQYKKNVIDAKAIVTDSELALTSISDSLTDIKALINRGLNGTYSHDERKSMAEEVDALKENIISQFNREFAGKFIFGGLNTSDVPIKRNGESLLYNNIELTSITQEEFMALSHEEFNFGISEGTNIDIALPAISIIGYGEQNMISVLDSLASELRNEVFDSQKLLDIDALNTRFMNNIQNNISKIGGRTVRLEKMEKKLNDGEHNMQSLFAMLEGVDIEKAITDYKMSEMVYNAALAVGAQIIQPTLVNYLK